MTYEYRPGTPDFIWPKRSEVEADIRKRTDELIATIRAWTGKNRGDQSRADTAEGLFHEAAKWGIAALPRTEFLER